MHTSTRSRLGCTAPAARLLLVAASTFATSLHARADIATTPTIDPNVLAAALNPQGLTVTNVTIRSGEANQFGVFSNFEAGTVTIRPGIVLSSGDVSNIGPLAEAKLPDYDPASPPARVNSAMSPSPDGGGTFEFNDYGSHGHIENFGGSYDVASIEVEFDLPSDTQVKFDFLFGTVEYPYWTSSFTDAFLVFLDGTDAANQITYDANGNPVQVGHSFAGLETTADLNTAFASPHGLIHHLTTTTAVLSAGRHTLRFEVGDVNDQVLDSAVFIANLRAEAGTEGTDPTDDTHGSQDCPRITVSPDSTSSCPLGMVSFSADADGHRPFTHQWRKNGVPIDAHENRTADSDTLELENVTGADVGSYDCVISNFCGSATTAAAMFTICFGDFNCDGGVDGGDITAFFAAWEDGDPSADINADGGVDGADVVDFFAHWEGGC
jgi:Immunoglobulin domain